jgi:hypothetical protein
MSDSSDSDVATTSVFKYTKKAFQKKRPVESDSNDESDIDSDDSPKRPKRPISILEKLEAADDEEESDDGIVIVAGGSTINKKKKEVIALDDSSDDDDYKPLNFRDQRRAFAENKDSIDVINKARQARMSLERAQRYHAEDVRLEIGIMDRLELPSVQKSGSELTVLVERNGTRYHRTIRNLEPLQKLMMRLRTDFQIKEDAHTTCALLYKNKEIDLTKTPASYQFKGVELLVLKVTVKEKPQPKKTLGPALNLILRTVKGGKIESEDTLVLRLREPFSKLIESYRTKNKLGKTKKIVLSFEGDALGMNQTPETHDMETDEIIEVTVR